jgi:hypothetical protein
VSLHLSWLICGAFLLLPIPSAFAAASVKLMELEGRFAPADRLPAVFGNHEQVIGIEINGVDAQSASLRADLFPVAGAMALPLAKDIHLQEGITFSNASPQRLRVSIKFPSVKLRVEVLVRLTLLQNAPQASPIQLGDLRFEVFPASVTKELTDLLKPKPDGFSTAVVFGPGQKLRHFLTGLHVPFEDGGIGTPDRFDPHHLYFGELSTEEQFQQSQDRSAGARLVLFSSDESLPTGVYSDQSSSGVFIHVTLPLLDNLNDDPRSQLGLIKVIHLLSAPTSPTN